MSALPRLRIAGSDEHLWLTVVEAASRTGYTDRHIRRLCGDTWMNEGQARTGGDGQWQIREDVIIAIEKQAQVDQVEADVRRLSKENRKELFFKQSVVQRLQTIRAAAIAAGKTITREEEDFCQRLAAEGTPVCWRNLHNWREHYEADGLRGLFDGRWKLAPVDAKPGHTDDEFFQLAREYWLGPNGVSKKEAWRWACQAANERGIVPRTLSQTEAYLRKIPLTVAVLRRAGEDRANPQVFPYSTKDYTTLSSNESWVGDHHQMDVWVNCGTEHQPDYRRPWLTVWMDERSRLVTGWCLYAHDPNQNSILSALRGAVLEYGVPKGFVIDNGKDYDSYTLQGMTKKERQKLRVAKRQGKIDIDFKQVGGIFGAMGCTARHVWAYHGQSKCIERFFGTLERSFGKQWETYCGSSPADRPQELFDQIDRAPVFDEFISSLAIWIHDRYHQDSSLADGLDGQSPAHVYEDSWNGTSKRAATAELLDILLMKMTRPLKVGRNGVSYMGLTYRMPVDHWIAWQGKEVYLRVDERCINHVTVWTPDDRFICAAESADKIPANATEQILRAAIRENKSRIKAVKTYFEKGRRSGESIADIATRAALETKLAAQQKQQQPDPEGGPAAIRPVRSDIEQQVNEVQRQVKRLRPAVGMEGQTEQVVESRPRFAYTPRDEAAADITEPTSSSFRYAGGGDDHE